MIELCQSEGIEVLLAELPYPADEASQRLANGVADIAEEYGVRFVNLLHEKGIVNYNTDMNDPEAHLNDSGAKKVSDWLGNYMTGHYGLPDHREDGRYAAWHDTYEEYSGYKVSRLKEQGSLDNYLMLLADSSYAFQKKPLASVPDNGASASGFFVLVKNCMQMIQVKDYELSAKEAFLFQ